MLKKNTRITCKKIPGATPATSNGPIGNSIKDSFAEILLIFLAITKLYLNSPLNMEQLALFAEAGQSKNLPPEMLEYRPGLIDCELADRLLVKFIADTPWKQTTQKMWDKEYLTPRLTAWYGDMGTDYSVSGEISNPMPWTEDLLKIKAMVEPLAGIRFNSVLLNYYRDGDDS